MSRLTFINYTFSRYLHNDLCSPVIYIFIDGHTSAVYSFNGCIKLATVFILGCSIFGLMTDGLCHKAKLLRLLN